ncbi:sigma-54 interaction domain-containing protein [Kaarinaea lacus]
MSDNTIRNHSLFIGESPQIQAVVRAAKIVASTDATVLIQGESGTGKELLAHTLHQHSRRADKAFHIINCAALPEHLVESELFGHRKGAFTSASHDYTGRLRAANGGTVFLDEIGELSLAVQAKLLRFLESGECHAVGESQPYRVNVRLITATNRDLFSMTQSGEFRQDLFYRLNVVPLQLPALRERTDDVQCLVYYFTRRLATEHQLTPPSYNKSTLKILANYAWPGNVRELRNFCERMVILLSGRQIQPDNLPVEFRSQANMPAQQQANCVFTLPDEGINLEQMEMNIIRQALAKSQGNRSLAARLLGISRDTLLYRIKKYAL